MNRLAQTLLRSTVLLVTATLGLVRPAVAQGGLTSPVADLATACHGRDGYADPAPPTRIYGDTWYVGTCGISVILITSDQGHILIDGGPVEAAPLVAANIEKLGFQLRDVKWIVSSHEHDDHVGAIAELKRLTGAKFAALETAAPLLAAGHPADDDPQRAMLKDFPPIAVDRVLYDRDDFRFAKLQVSVRSTPAHSPGSASWTWQACDLLNCRTVTYADSATTVSGDAYRFSDHPTRIEAVREGLKRIGELPCDILITPHPGASDFFDRVSARKPLGDANACRTYATAARERFEARLTKEAAGAK